MENPVEISSVVIDMLRNERPRSVLEISGFDCHYGELISDCLKRALSKKTIAGTARIDRVDLVDGLISAGGGIYDNIYPSDSLSCLDEMDEYDVILVFHLFENMDETEAKDLLESLLMKTKKQVFLITPEYPYDLGSDDKISGVRSYHPVFFLGMDFSYKMFATSEGSMQAYSFFPVIDYPELACDKLAEPQAEARKLRIAYVLPHQNLTGGLKAMLQQMKELKDRGHSVTAYYRSNTVKRAIPSWSHLKDDDVSAQIVIPAAADYLDHIDNADIIMLGWMDQAQEFFFSKIPVVLWEQGSQPLFGDYGDMQSSTSPERSNLHCIYRMPVHLLAVSETIQAILKGVFNREAQLFPNGLDTDFYYPLEHKNNKIPIVLLAGTPGLEFKGFKFAMIVLEAVREAGLPFKVWWSSQDKISLSGVSFDVEKFIKPSQEKLAELFRNADVFLSTSLYESFSLPPIEAMASGTAVIATDCGGINTYARPGSNCLLCEQGDYKSVFYAIQHLLQNPSAREQLAAAGRKTALEYSFSSVIPLLEQCLYRIVATHEK